MQFNEARKRISSAVSRKAIVQKKFSRGFSMAKIQARKDKCTDNPILLLSIFLSGEWGLGFSLIFLFPLPICPFALHTFRQKKNTLTR
jgi:hypothetical protein